MRAFMDPSLAAVDPAGGVEAVRVVRDPRTSEGKGIAFVLFRTPQACKVGGWACGWACGSLGQCVGAVLRAKGLGALAGG